MGFVLDSLRGAISNWKTDMKRLVEKNDAVERPQPIPVRLRMGEASPATQKLTVPTNKSYEARVRKLEMWWVFCLRCVTMKPMALNLEPRL